MAKNSEKTKTSARNSKKQESKKAARPGFIYRPPLKLLQAINAEVSRLSKRRKMNRTELLNEILAKKLRVPL